METSLTLLYSNLCLLVTSTSLLLNSLTFHLKKLNHKKLSLHSLVKVELLPRQTSLANTHHICWSGPSSVSCACHHSSSHICCGTKVNPSTLLLPSKPTEWCSSRYN